MAMDMRGTLNVSKFQKTPDQPRFYGKCLINGVEYSLKGWEKEGRDGLPWISLLFEGGDDGFEQAAPKKASLFTQPTPEPRKPTPIPKDLGAGYSDLLGDDDAPF